LTSISDLDLGGRNL